MAEIFISYSRRDKVFVERLMKALNNNGYPPEQIWVDWEDIPATTDWMDAIQKGIESANSIIVILSPEWAKSSECVQEIKIATRYNKRIFPIVYQNVDPKLIQPEVASLNWTFFRETDNFDEAMQKLLAALKTDLPWVAQHTALLLRAMEWDAKNRDDAYLLRGSELQEAETWWVASYAKEATPKVSPLQAEFINASRQYEGRRQRRNNILFNPIGLVVVGVVSAGEYLQKQFGKRDTASVDSQSASQVTEKEVKPVEVSKLFSVSTDQASGVDQLNYNRFADAFVTMIQNPEAKTPITIGIYGQWGSGKSFLMKKIIEALKKDKQATPTSWLRKISDYFKRLFGKESNQQVDTIVIEFNAWVYSGSEHLWASLVTHLYREIESYFGVTAHYHRLINALKRFIPKTAGVFLFYAIPGLLISLLVGFETIKQTWAAANLALKAAGVSLLGGSLLATVPVLITALREFGDNLFLSRAVNLQKLAAKPDFRDQIGIMADIKSEIAFIGRLLESRKKKSRETRVVLFIDDLDRCEHRKAVEVLQAIMLLLADRDGSPFVIFLGIDARVIVRAIEEHYGDVLVKAGINGYEYLDKIVQMPFVIPTATRADIGNYVESLIWTKAEKEMVEAKFAPKSEAAGRQTPKPGEPRKEEKPFVQEPAAASFTELVPVTFSEPERKALNKCAEDIVDNPRKIKRIVNIYRLVRLLLKPNFLEYQKIISWILLTEQWPLHASWILEEIVNDKFQNGILSKIPNATIMDAYNQVKDNIYSNEMDSLIAIDADPKVFYQFIQKAPVLTIDEIFYHLYPLTFNLNPAIKFEISKYMSKRAEDYVQTQIKQNLPNQSDSTSLPQIKSATLEKAIQDISDAKK